MKYTHIIWDFNGTILNDIQTGIDAVNVLLKRYGKPQIESTDRYREAFGFPVIDYYDSLGLERENFSRYAPEWVTEYNLREPNAPIFEGITETLEYFRLKGIPQYLLSATESDMLSRQVARLGIGEYFTELLGQNTIEAHGKTDVAKHWAERVKPQKALFIGDTVHDFEVAQAIDADCILLAWGHQDRKRLAATGCRVFETILDVQKAFESGEME